MSSVSSGNPRAISSPSTTATSTSSPIPFDINKVKEFLAPYYLNIACGAVFGFGLHRGRVHESSIIIGQMSFSHFVMLKMFLTAASISILAIYALPRFFKKDVNRPVMTEHFPRSATGVAIGCGILGVGMTLSGSCPASVYAQVGAGSFSGIVVLLGCFIGAYAYGMYDAFCAKNPSFVDYRISSHPAVPLLDIKPEQSVLEKVIANGKYSYDQLVMYIPAALLSFVLLLELVINWKSDIAEVDPNASWFSAAPGLVSGLIVGASQLLSFLYTSRPLGSSSSFSCVIANSCPIKDAPYHGVVKDSHKFQVASMFGVTLGSALSAILSLRAYVGSDLSYLRLLVGGALLIFGGQFAHGCTSGHGITGLGYLSTKAAVGVAAMFSAAILTRIVLAVFGF